MKKSTKLPSGVRDITNVNRLRQPHSTRSQGVSARTRAVALDVCNDVGVQHVENVDEVVGAYCVLDAVFDVLGRLAAATVQLITMYMSTSRQEDQHWSRDARPLVALLRVPFTETPDHATGWHVSTHTLCNPTIRHVTGLLFSPRRVTAPWAFRQEGEASLGLPWRIAAMTTSAAALVGGRYEIVRTLGHGSFGHTFLARDRETDRTVAIKLLDARSGHDAKAYELFRREADVLRAVRHHGIPEVYDTLQDVWNGSPAAFLVMEYIEGTSLAQIIDEKRLLDGADVVHIFLELLGILDYLHGRVPPILHRDIKPSNIILRPNGFPALVDFGSVRRVFMGPEESGSTVAGTYGYMPYEQYMGQATPASDLFATAATFLHVLTGRPPRDFMNDDGRIEVPETLPGEPRLRAVIARLLRPRQRNASRVRVTFVTHSSARRRRTSQSHHGSRRSEKVRGACGRAARPASSAAAADRTDGGAAARVHAGCVTVHVGIGKGG